MSQKFHPPIRILAIDPGTKGYLGVAIFEGERLLDWRLKLLESDMRQPSTIASGARWAILPAVKRYGPQILVTVRYATSRHDRRCQHKGARMLAKSLQIAGKQLGLRVYTYSHADVRRFFGQGRRMTRREISRIIATQQYPFLYPVYERELNKVWFRRKYYLQVFDAVALGTYGLHRLKAHGEEHS
jgi:hypothetical protein